MHSCAASVLLWAITSDGRWTASIVAAIVIVLPVPVAPSSVWKRSPDSIPAASASTAAGWSAVGEKVLSSSNFGHDFRLAGKQARSCPQTAVDAGIPARVLPMQMLER